jgi:hypothetical protein
MLDANEDLPPRLPATQKCDVAVVKSCFLHREPKLEQGSDQFFAACSGVYENHRPAPASQAL